MKKIFISQPMAGKSDEDIYREREEAVEELERLYPDEPLHILDSFFRGAPHKAAPVWFLGKAIELLSEADVAVFLHGWENARGCQLEHQIAKEYGIPTKEFI